MQVVIELPDEMAEELSRFGGDMPREFLESFAVDGYRRGRLTGLQVRRLLGLSSRFELEELLQRAQVLNEYTAQELERDFQNSHRSSSRHNARPLTPRS